MRHTNFDNEIYGEFKDTSCKPYAWVLGMIVAVFFINAIVGLF